MHSGVHRPVGGVGACRLRGWRSCGASRLRGWRSWVQAGGLGVGACRLRGWRSWVQAALFANAAKRGSSPQVRRTRQGCGFVGKPGSPNSTGCVGSRGSQVRRIRQGVWTSTDFPHKHGLKPGSAKLGDCNPFRCRCEKGWLSSTFDSHAIFVPRCRPKAGARLSPGSPNWAGAPIRRVCGLNGWCGWQLEGAGGRGERPPASPLRAASPFVSGFPASD